MSNRAAARAALERKRRAGGTTAGTTGTTGTRGTRKIPPPPPIPIPSGIPPGATTFRPVAESIMPRQMAQAWGRTPEERQRLETLFSELLSVYRRRLREASLPQNDVARAASYLVTASYMVAQDDRVKLDEAQLDACANT